MKPLTCRAGYPMPFSTKDGKRYEVWGFCATVSDTTAASRFTLVDSPDFKIIANDKDLNPVNNRRPIVDVKGLANGDGYLSVIFPEPYKTIEGVVIAASTANLEAGKTFVYVR
jgi:hypothetical protein